jgi:hypothetical protein
MLLAKKSISPGDVKRYTVDYSDWLDDGETVSSVALTITYESGSGDASISSHSTTSSQVIFFITAGTTVAGTVLDVNIAMTSSVGQVKNDHVEFVLFAP